MMQGDSRLNVSILDADISPRLRERLQAQVQTAIRSLPRWPFALLRDRMSELSVTGLQLIVEPVHSTEPSHPLGLGEIEGRPAARLRPRVTAGKIEWGQDLRYLVAKALGYLLLHSQERLSGSAGPAIQRDGLRAKASRSSAAWEDETDMGLFLEMFAAYALRDGHAHWSTCPRFMRSCENGGALCVT
jgi:hypothetical protein